nr:MAG TPA: hypothetical protein [Caudoviricetes sp.]
MFYSPKPHGLRLNLIIDAAPAKVNSFPQGIFAPIFKNPPVGVYTVTYDPHTQKTHTGG